MIGTMAFVAVGMSFVAAGMPLVQPLQLVPSVNPSWNHGCLVSICALLRVCDLLKHFFLSLLSFSDIFC